MIKGLNPLPGRCKSTAWPVSSGNLSVFTQNQPCIDWNVDSGVS